MKTTFTAAKSPCPVLLSRAMMICACLMLTAFAFVSADALRTPTSYFQASLLRPRDNSDPASLIESAAGDACGRIGKLLRREISLHASREAAPSVREQSGGRKYADWTLAHFIKEKARDAVAMMAKRHSKR